VTGDKTIFEIDVELIQLEQAAEAIRRRIEELRTQRSRLEVKLEKSQATNT
jgi:hypothetical protein